MRSTAVGASRSFLTRSASSDLASALTRVAAVSASASSFAHLCANNMDFVVVKKVEKKGSSTGGRNSGRKVNE